MRHVGHTLEEVPSISVYGVLSSPAHKRDGAHCGCICGEPPRVAIASVAGEPIKLYSSMQGRHTLPLHGLSSGRWRSNLLANHLKSVYLRHGALD